MAKGPTERQREHRTHAGGKSEAEKIGADNVRWFVGRAEELKAETESFELISIGEAFHRLDQEAITRRALRWLQPRGCLAVLGWNNLVSGDAPWQRIVADITRSWKRRIAPNLFDDAREKPGSGPEHNRSVFEDFGFEDVGNHEFPHTRERTVESIVGWLFSTSRFSKKVLGEKAKEFEEEITVALLAHDARGFALSTCSADTRLGEDPETDESFGKPCGNVASAPRLGLNRSIRTSESGDCGHH